MKTIYTILICFLLANATNAQERYLTKNGAVTFFSSAPMEDIKADNNQVLSIVDASSGKMAIAILMKSFMFKKALMQEHFNENYVESDKFPKATFKGDILNFDTIKDSETKVEVKGTMTIHGKSKEIVIPANITRNEDNILVKGEFNLLVADYDIEIPGAVAKNIAKKIKVTFKFNHKPYKK
ncbi:YceI family protein [Polaribacter sp. Hel1_85]|uniref:YceI family protein n=1 Tax=Polaribacter sp. Hel1_85 TaxID=1250005 RepID=UPI00052CD4C2|nr:YceI family protein [Polaribacter sp. Hel1_85]KGL64148.1 YceI family protein [Polaribacter sp. Hel1_85]